MMIVLSYKYQVSVLKLSFRRFWYHSVAITEFIVTRIRRLRIMHRLENRIYSEKFMRKLKKTLKILKAFENSTRTYLSLFPEVEAGVEPFQPFEEPDVHGREGDNYCHEEPRGIVETENLCQDAELGHVLVQDRLLSQHEHQVQRQYHYEVAHLDKE
jgi:hypothetical protein